MNAKMWVQPQTHERDFAVIFSFKEMSEIFKIFETPNTQTKL